ncbi:MAG: NAD(P)H-dependent oxidoreductase subunit E, partial [Elusimicrobia bacterium]|nr:NAD(P)H-dependent oxidoreductase subunit E [Elusimicrobiota bacterium]
FSLRPKAEHTCVVCLGTACYVKGAGRVADELARAFSVKVGETTIDKKFGLQTARCLGACGLAPAVVLDNEVVARVTPEALVEKIREKLENGHVA